MTALEPGELILELEVPQPGGEHLPEGDGAEPLLVRAGRRRGRARRRRRRASRSPAWRRSRGCWTGPDELDRATPLPGTAYKVDLARPLVRRALEAVARLSAPWSPASCSRRGRRRRRFRLRRSRRLLLEPVLERRRAGEHVRRRRRSSCSARTSSRPPRRTVRCPDWERGPGASLRCGLAALPPEAEAAVVVLADGPELDPAAIDRVIATWRAENGPGRGRDLRRHEASPGAAGARGLGRNSRRGRQEARRRPRRLRRSIPSRRRRFRR